MVWSDDENSTVSNVFQQTLKGFDGEITDPATGWQFLGAGHRTYNPFQRYFVSEDPVRGGYGFGSNNPIMYSDPSGNIPEWLGKIFKSDNYLASVGLSAVHNKFAKGLGAILGWTATAIASYGVGNILGLVFVPPAGLAFSSAIKPANKGLQKASMITGSVYAGGLFVAGLLAAGMGLVEAVVTTGTVLTGAVDVAEAEGSNLIGGDIWGELLGSMERSDENN